MAESTSEKLSPVEQMALERCEKIARGLGWSEECNQPFWSYIEGVLKFDIHLVYPDISLLMNVKDGDHAPENIRRLLKKALHAYESIMVDSLSTCCLAPEILVKGSLAHGIDQITCLHCCATVRGPKETLWREWKKKYFKPL